MYRKLFSPKKIGTMTVRNRIVMTAMGNYLAEADGCVSDADIAFYGARAKGGVGLVITECACINLEIGKGNCHQMAVDNDEHIEGLKKLADEIHKYGSAIAVQIYHPGRQGIAAINGNTTMQAPSATECQAVHQPTHEMTKEEINDTIDRFIQGAKRLQKAGIDAVEVHGAHGYLIGEFLSPYTNKRTDEYGGSFENRMRFLDEIIAGIRRECGKNYPIIVRYSADEFMSYVGHPELGLNLEDGIKIAKHLEAQGVDALDVSCGIYETMNTAWEPVGFDQGWKIHIPTRVKEAVSIPVIGVSVIREPEYAEQILQEGKVDFVGSARQFFADPEWGNKAQQGKEKSIRKCISCLHCMESLMMTDINQMPMACAINYEGGKETHFGDAHLKQDGKNRVVAVVGAGPAGMEAARILAKRKFNPIVFEKNHEVGGQILYASKPPKKGKTAWLTDYQKAQLEDLGVEIRLNHAPTLEELKELNPYAVFVAQGSIPIMPKSLPGIEGEKIFTPIDILSGKVTLRDKKVAVIGSGMTGIETAELLGAQGNEVTVFEMEDKIGPGVFFQSLIDIMGRITEYGVKLFPKHRLIKIEGTTVTMETTDTKEAKIFNFDAIIVSLGTASNTELLEEMQTVFDKVVLLGDAAKVGRIEGAIGSGYKAAFEL
ncbi:NADH:flavin oxidoreductases, Old yellow enzyme family [Clostridium aceticum]|uniref:NADH:flavin oxidoreductases, Old yellow enzyme family n=1 Tax=Clostridium aceticum TaxID=84022 RepID=A0A0D8I8B1_9CLOT|nr:FAD-dependent oxidoreductase [Clostridium aceticum]AKL97290.1 NADH:flavin oxidoreductases, Old yellow enzyme family [Clostridium aceticum]KJF26309.1 NADH:flavin oxidoreductase [Clostridium aceticum]